MNFTIIAMVKPSNSSNSSEAQDVCGYGEDQEDSDDYVSIGQVLKVDINHGHCRQLRMIVDGLGLTFLRNR